MTIRNNIKQWVNIYIIIKKYTTMSTNTTTDNNTFTRNNGRRVYKKGIYTGKGTISLMALLGIWSVSALTSLPGLAVSPISEKLLTIFPSTTQLDIQMLTTLPSLFIIPFILLAGVISGKVNDIKLLYAGLWLYLLSGLLYFLCTSMTQLIFVSALLGIGAGIIIPLSTSLVSKFFSGEQRTRQYGYISALTNITLVVATAVTGYLADIQWRLPFVVYLLPIISILLVSSIRNSESTISEKREQPTQHVADGTVNYRELLKYMLYYLLITYLVMAVSINLPFLLGKLGYDSGVSGMVISLFFLAMMLPGFFINRIIAVLREYILLFSLLLIALGLIDIFFNSSLAFIILGCIAAGVGYGIAQPYIYDVTASLAPPQKTTYALALVMTMNYVAILVSPFIVDWVQELCRVKSENFPFLLNAVTGFVALIFMFMRSSWLKYKKSRP